MADNRIKLNPFAPAVVIEQAIADGQAQLRSATSLSRLAAEARVSLRLPFRNPLALR